MLPRTLLVFWIRCCAHRHTLLLALSALAAIGATLLHEIGDLAAVPLAITATRASALPWAVLCYYCTVRSAAAALLSGDARLAVLSVLLAVGAWLIGRRQVDRAWHLLWMGR